MLAKESRASPCPKPLVAATQGPAGSLCGTSVLRATASSGSSWLLLSLWVAPQRTKRKDTPLRRGNLRNAQLRRRGQYPRRGAPAARAARPKQRQGNPGTTKRGRRARKVSVRPTVTRTSATHSRVRGGGGEGASADRIAN